MTDAFDPKQPFAGVELPAQDLAKLSFCSGSRLSHVQKWMGQLQATRIAQTSAQLYQSLPEINRLKTDPKTRLEMLEQLRPHVQSTIAGLARDFLGQPLILPAPAQKAAIVAQALQKAMVDGYSLCIQEWCTLRNLNKQQRLDLATALYRAMFSISRLYLRSCQIYTQLPRGLWLHLHRLYRTAEHYQLLAAPVDDTLLETQKVSRVGDAYRRAIMLACSRPNQLSQSDIALVFSAFESWAVNLELQEEVDPDNNNPYVVNLSSDAPPTYKILFNGSETDYLLEPDFSTLIRALQSPMSATALEVQTRVNIPSALVDHLTTAWGAPADRRQPRQSVKTAVDICVGLIGCHYHLADQRSFEQFLQQRTTTDTNGFAETNPRGLTPGDRREKPAGVSAHTPLRVTVQNVSAGGYCLYWQNAVPANVTAGQLLGIREAGQPEWLVGVVRWVRQLRGASQMGVQVLALEAKPAAAVACYDTGGQSAPMRALQLPPDTHNRLPPTLVTAAVPFQEASRVRIHGNGRVITAQLHQCLFSTGHMRQFSYQVLASDEAPEHAVELTSAADNAEFDADWG